jgi:hypothetical protein
MICYDIYQDKKKSKAEKLPYSGAVPRLPGFPEMSCHWAWLRSFGWIPWNFAQKVCESTAFPSHSIVYST